MADEKRVQKRIFADLWEWRGAEDLKWEVERDMWERELFSLGRRHLRQ